jgi:hypothetical protein
MITSRFLASPLSKNIDRNHQQQVSRSVSTSLAVRTVAATLLSSKMISIARPSVLRAARSQLFPSRAVHETRFSALARLLSTLAVLEQRNGKLQPSSFSAIAAAQKLGGSVTAFVAGSGVKGTAAAEAAKIKGLEKVLAVENDAYEKVRWWKSSEKVLRNGIDKLTGCHV